MTLELSFVNWLLAILPVIVLLFCLLALKWEASCAGAASWLSAILIAIFRFGADTQLIALANSKGMSLSVYVLLIIWTAIFLYNVADSAKAIKTIGDKISALTDNRSLLALLLAWGFTSVLQGLAGFGVPVAVVAPIMVAMGFPPLVAVSACLLGHSWSISFGSMGSSYNTIQLVTSIPGEVIAPQMALLFAVAIFATGFEVLYIEGKGSAIKRGAVPVLCAAVIMSFLLWLMTYLNMSQIATLIAAVGGCGFLALWASKHRSEKQKSAEKPLMSFHLAAAPYYMVIAITLIAQLPPIKAVVGSLGWGLDYPAVTTAFGYTAEAVVEYSKIKFFSHPAPILLVSALVGGALYIRKGKTDIGVYQRALKTTIKKCIPTSVGISTMVMMALIMGDSGMTNMIAQGIAKVCGNFYPLLSPFIGVLGSFITGSNTNSNIMFGLLQYQTGLLIGVSGVLLAAAQSVGGSLGVSMAPSTIMMGAANVGLDGQETTIMRKTMKFCLLNALLVGIVVFIAA